MKKETPCEKARKLIIENRQKGQIYRFEFFNDPQIYTGIPVDVQGLAEDDEDCFELKVLEPSHAAGIRMVPYRRIAEMAPLQ